MALPALVLSGTGMAGGLRPRPVSEPFVPLQQILLALWRGAVSGELARLKVCADQRCRLAFYDRSRNQSRRWCTGGECGNRVRLARHRAKLRAQDST
jgi:predicted RNA-binding Zn ribbon-like protein